MCEHLPQVLKAGIYWSLLITWFLSSATPSPFYSSFNQSPGAGKENSCQRKAGVGDKPFVCKLKLWDQPVQTKQLWSSEGTAQYTKAVCEEALGGGGGHPENMLVPEAFCPWLHNPWRNSQREPIFIFRRGQSFGLFILILHCGALAYCYYNSPWCLRWKTGLHSSDRRKAEKLGAHSRLWRP